MSGEGWVFWLVWSVFLIAEQYFWAKMWPGIVFMLVLGEVLVVVFCMIFCAGFFLICVAVGMVLGLSFGIVGVVVGMGAMYLDFRVDSVARVVAGFVGVLFMVMVLILVFIVIGLLGILVYFVFRSGVEGVLLQMMEWVGSSVVVVAVIGVCCVAMVVFLCMGVKRLWAKGISND